MTGPDAPREAEVRKALASLCVSHPHFTRLAGDVLALLDAGRKDRERVDWLEADPCRATHNALRAWEDPKLSFRDAIDQARGA